MTTRAVVPMAPIWRGGGLFVRLRSVGLWVTGKAAFDRSGKLTISSGHASGAKTGIALSSASFVLATLQTNVAGLFIQAVVTNPGGSSFTIFLNKAPSVSVVVAWLAVN